MNLGLKYLSWHYIQKTKQIITIMGNFLASGVYYFSAKDLIFSLFAPWKKETMQFERGFDLENFINVVIGNLIAIAIGFLMRVFLLIMFVIFEILVLVIGLSALLIWIALPFLIIIGIIYGFKLIFNYV